MLLGKVRVYPIKPPFVLDARAGEAERPISGADGVVLG
jgi:hypothetical protein